MKNEIDIEKMLAQADPQLGQVIKAVQNRMGKLRSPLSNTTSFEALLRAIIYQQMTGKAAATIYKRLSSAIKKPITPAKILALSHDELRAFGLSNAKADYAGNLAEWFTANAKTTKALPVMTNDDVIQTLTDIKGIGIWTANVFLIFNLGRLDVAPISDMGLRKGAQLAYGLESLPTTDFLLEKSAAWKPYRSIASMYLWQSGRLRLTKDDLEFENNVRNK